MNRYEAEEALRKPIALNRTEYLEAVQTVMTAYQAYGDGFVTFTLGKESDHQGTYGNILVIANYYNKDKEWVYKSQVGELYGSGFKVQGLVEVAPSIIRALRNEVARLSQEVPEQVTQLEEALARVIKERDEALKDVRRLEMKISKIKRAVDER